MKRSLWVVLVLALANAPALACTPLPPVNTPTSFDTEAMGLLTDVNGVVNTFSTEINSVTPPPLNLSVLQHGVTDAQHSIQLAEDAVNTYRAAVTAAAMMTAGCGVVTVTNQVITDTIHVISLLQLIPGVNIGTTILTAVEAVGSI